MTVFLTEKQSTENFIIWLGEKALQLFLIMGNPDTLLTDLAHILSCENPYLTIADLEKIDFEVYNHVLEHGLQYGMHVDTNILNLYHFPGTEEQNLTLLIVISGSAMIDLLKGLKVARTQAPDTKTLTFIQVFYCYQPMNIEPISTHILLGTSWFIDV